MAYKGGLRDKATLRYEEEVYTPEGAKVLTDKELRKEYSRLRSIARKRLERFQGTEWTDTQIYQLNAGVYKPLKDIKSDRELRHLFSQVARFVTAQTGSVSGLENQRKTAIQTLNDRGYTFINKQNYRQFADFMEYSRIANLNKLFDSKRVADFYASVEKRKDMNPKDMQEAFQHWIKKEKTKKKIQNINPRNSSMYRSQMNEIPPRSKRKKSEDYD